jgi:predicted permease
MFGFLHWRSLFRRQRFEAGMEDEFAFHREARTNHLIAEGMPPAEARRLAQLEFGGEQRYREECREAHRVHWFDELRADIRFGLRTLRKAPVFSATAVLSLALGIGANAFVFSVFNSLLLRPLPIDAPERVKFVETATDPGHSFPTYRELRDNNSTFTGLAGYRISPMSLQRSGNAERIWGFLATGNYFDVLGVKPAAGRFFHQEDDMKPGASPYAVLSYSAWKGRFGGDSSIVGQTVHINGLSYTILGVAPDGFHGTELLFWPDVWVPMMMEPQIEIGNAWLENRNTWNTWIVGRLRPNVSEEQATFDLNRIAADLARRYPDPDQGLRLKLADPGLIGSSIRGPVRLFTTGLLLLAGLVLLTACSNLAGLMLARATDRQRELAIRTSIGAGRGRIIRQLLTETLMLSVFGGAAGLALAAFLSKLLSQWHAPVDFPLQIEIVPDWRVFAFATMISLVTGILFGLGPAVQLSKTDVNGLLKGGSGFVVLKQRFRFALRDLFVAVEVALCFVLVFASILSLSALQHTLTMSIGFQPQGVTTAAIDLGLAGYEKTQGMAFQQRLLPALRDLPGVDDTAVANSIPLSIDHSSTSVEAADRPPERGRNAASATYYQVSPGFFATLGIRLLSGRDFNPHDNQDGPRVAVVNQAFARQIMHTESPVGKTFREGFGGPLNEVIGLVEDGKYVSLTEEPHPALFWAGSQRYNSTTTIVVKSRRPAAEVLGQIRKLIASMDPRIPMYGAGTLESMLGFALVPMHAAALALSAFGLLALILAITGIHGLVAYSVARRTRELGIRIAIGARPSEVLRLILGRLTVLVAVGLVAGIVLALAAGQTLSAVIYGVSARDPGLLLLVVVLLMIAAGISSWPPARRALRTDPMAALRYE